MRKLYLIPTLLAPGTKDIVLSDYVFQIVNSIDYFFVEEIRSARRFISEVGVSKKIEELSFFKLNKETTVEEVKKQLNAVPEDAAIGVLSEAGCPCIADPGTLLVKVGHEKGWEVIPLVGPSSILMALIASGFNGQSFVFHGYLPIEKDKREKIIRTMEKESASIGRTQIFMETPYRNNQLMSDLIAICGNETKICIAANLTGENQFIKTMKVKNWKNNKIDLHKQPAIFLLSTQ